MERYWSQQMVLDTDLFILGDIADAIYRAFLSPGELLLSFFAYVASDSIAVLTRGHGAIVVPFLLALLFWTCLLYTSPSPRDS